jgi:hypothetical protein
VSIANTCLEDKWLPGALQAAEKEWLWLMEDDPRKNTKLLETKNSFRGLSSKHLALRGANHVLIWGISLRTFAALCVLCGKKAFKTINRKER